jgi:hypothetical protein
MSQIVIFMIIRLVTLSVNILRPEERDFISNSKNISNSRKRGSGSEMNITLTMIWCQIVIQLVHVCTFWVVQSGFLPYFLLNFDTDNCLLKKIQQ